METLPQAVHHQILQYLKFTHLWNLSLVNQFFCSLVNAPGVVDGIFEERWGYKEHGATLDKFLQAGNYLNYFNIKYSTEMKQLKNNLIIILIIFKARDSHVELLGHNICCSRWKLEPDHIDSPSPSISQPSSSNKREVQYDDFDEEILPESDDFGDEGGEEGKSVFEDGDFVDYKTKLKKESLFVTFEANAKIQLHLNFVESYLTCEPLFKV